LEQPRCPNLRQEVDSAFIRKHHACMGWQGSVRTPQPGYPLAAVWRISLGYPLRPFPHPAERMEPAAEGCCGHLDAMCGLERRRASGTTPPHAAPAVGTWSVFAYGPQRACEPGHENGCWDSARELPVWSNTSAQAPGAIRAHNPGHTGARAKEERRNLGRISARRTEQQDMERQARALPGAAENRTHLALLRWRELPEGGRRHRRGLLLCGWACPANVSHEYLTVLMSCGPI
jgi:hypothetical protein